MEETTRVEQAGGHGPSLELTAQRFARWREVRRRGEHVPPALWAAAVELAKAHGVQRIVEELQLDVERLKRRMQHVAAATPAAGETDAQFVEMFTATTTAPAVDVRECVVELHNARGATMRVELAGSGLAALADLCSAFCGAR